MRFKILPELIFLCCLQLVDGTVLTIMRTAAASACAAKVRSNYVVLARCTLRQLQTQVPTLGTNYDVHR